MTGPAPLQSALLTAEPGVRHAFFTREGGVSTGLYAGLNVGRGSKDDPVAVEANRALAAGWFGMGVEALATVYQTHSAVAHVLDRAPAAAPDGDGVITATPGLICAALSADCAPVLIADSRAGIVAAVHAGWRGALGGVVASAIEAMVALGADPHRMTAAVGPCIAPASYEVGTDFLDCFTTADPDFERFFAPGVSAEKRQFDLPGFVLGCLAAAGVARAEWIGADTCADAALFYSNRRAVKRGEGDYGRLLSAIMLTP
jgi:YfiH family protein